DAGIGRLLNIGRMAIVIVLADLVILLQLFDDIHCVTPDMTYGDARCFGVLMRNLDQLLAPFLIELRDTQANGLAFRCWRKAEVGIYDRLFSRVNERAI